MYKSSYSKVFLLLAVASSTAVLWAPKSTVGSLDESTDLFKLGQHLLRDIKTFIQNLHSEISPKVTGNVKGFAQNFITLQTVAANPDPAKYVEVRDALDAVFRHAIAAPVMAPILGGNGTLNVDALSVQLDGYKTAVEAGENFEKKYQLVLRAIDNYNQYFAASSSGKEALVRVISEGIALNKRVSELYAEALSFFDAVDGILRNAYQHKKYAMFPLRESSGATPDNFIPAGTVLDLSAAGVFLVAGEVDGLFKKIGNAVKMRSQCDKNLRVIKRTQKELERAKESLKAKTKSNSKDNGSVKGGSVKGKKSDSAELKRLRKENSELKEKLAKLNKDLDREKRHHATRKEMYYELKNGRRSASVPAPHRHATVAPRAASVPR